MVWLLLGLGGLAALWALPHLIEGRRILIDRSLRDRTSGTFAALDQGVTHYRWQGPVRGPVAVLIHGLTTPSMVWDDIGAGLGQLGYRVLSYDLYGRGLSDAPLGVQDEAFFLAQLSGLLAHQGLEDNLTLVGYSMGGAIATAFAAKNPHRIRQVVLIAPSGVKMNESGFSRFCRRVPVIGDWVFGTLSAVRGRKALAADRQADQAVITMQMAEYERKGFVRSVLASRRGILRDVQQEQHRALGRDAVPVLAIWGTDDDVIPISSIGELARWNRNIHQDEIEGAGHGLPYTHSKEVIGLMRKFILDRPFETS